MALYALGDMHLAFSVDKPMDKFGKIWKNHEEKLEKNCRKLIGNGDTLVITGDHSWGKNLAEAKADLAFIAALPGNKILLRGNHDMFWDAKKTAVLNQEYEPQLHFLQNNHYHYQDYALVGTKGYTFEGPFYISSRGQIVGWDEANEKQAKKLVAREAERLRISFESARGAGFRKYIMFLHYPPNPDTITLLTAHKSKGKEFPTVVIYGVEEFEESEEGWNLLYVSMTRAKRNLFLLQGSFSDAPLYPEFKNYVD